MVDNCNKFDFAKPGDECQNLLDRNGISIEHFYAWNPSVGSSCVGLWANVHVCVGVHPPSPVQSGIAGNCDTFYKVVAGYSCWTSLRTRSGHRPGGFLQLEPGGGG